MLSKGEIQVLNAARMVLRGVVEEAGALRWDVQDAQVGDTDGFDYGILSATADAAEGAIFDVLNKARSYCDIAITDEEMHMREEVEV